MIFEPDPGLWAGETFGCCDLGDARLTKRLVDYAARQAAAPSSSTNVVCQGNDVLAEATYRFLRNERASPVAIADGGFCQTVKLCRTRKLVLAIEDGTNLVYGHSVAGQLGVVGGAHGMSRGICVQTVLAVDGINGDILGLLAQERWTRAGVRVNHDQNKAKKIPYREKESFIWEKMSTRVAALLEDTSNIISICDRGADIHEYLQYKTANRQRFVVRSAYDRCVGSVEKHLAKTVRSWPVRGGWIVKIAQRGPWKNRKDVRRGRAARTANLSVRFGTVDIVQNASDRCKVEGRKRITLNAVYVSEHHPNKGADPLEWTLLTSEPVTSLEDAARIIKIYEKRWLIEEFHAAWKTGCRVEGRRSHNATNLERLAVILAFIAVRLLQLRTLQESDPTAECTRVLSRPQWQCLWRSVNRGEKLPSSPPTILWAIQAIARLAGWRKTSTNTVIGWLSLWQGWDILQQQVQGWHAAQE